MTEVEVAVFIGGPLGSTLIEGTAEVPLFPYLDADGDPITALELPADGYYTLADDVLETPEGWELSSYAWSVIDAGWSLPTRAYGWTGP